MQLHGAGYRKLFRNMYGDKPSWAPNLSGYDRSRAIINVLTRMRYCTRGASASRTKGTPGTQEQGLYPWFEVPGRVERDLKVVCGHWSALGLTITQGVHAIDTGAVWGGKLTALQLDTDELRVVQVRGPTYRHRAQRPPATGARRPGAATQGRNRGGNAAATRATVAHAAVAVVVADGAVPAAARGWAPTLPALQRACHGCGWCRTCADAAAGPFAATGAAARAQVGVTTRYDPAYQVLAIPAATCHWIGACARTWWCAPCAIWAWTCRHTCMRTCAAVSVPIRRSGACHGRTATSIIVVYRT